MIPNKCDPRPLVCRWPPLPGQGRWMRHVDLGQFSVKCVSLVSPFFSFMNWILLQTCYELSNLAAYYNLTLESLWLYHIWGRQGIHKPMRFFFCTYIIINIVDRNPLRCTVTLFALALYCTTFVLCPCVWQRNKLNLNLAQKRHGQLISTSLRQRIPH